MAHRIMNKKETLIRGAIAVGGAVPGFVVGMPPKWLEALTSDMPASYYAEEYPYAFFNAVLWAGITTAIGLKVWQPKETVVFEDKNE